MRFFVHLADPSFPEAPWPNTRRLGPFDTLAEAQAQAAADLAGGHLAEDELVGIYSEDDSHALSVAATAEVTDHSSDGRLQATIDQIRAGQAEERRRVAAEAATRAAGLPDGEQVGLLAALVGAGVLTFPAEQERALKELGLL